jgi:hypothetical protein
MSVSGILSSSFANFNVQNVKSRTDQIQQDFQQLGEDLQSGNLSAAKSDFSALQQLAPQNSSSSSTQGTLMQDFTQLGKDLQSGNLANAQQDYSSMQQDIQSKVAVHHHHHHGGGGSDINQLVSQLAQALQSGDLSSAQQAYGSLQQDMENFALNSVMQSSSWNAASGVSVSA